jgi:hypothetical protein
VISELLCRYETIAEEGIDDRPKLPWHKVGVDILVDAPETVPIASHYRPRIGLGSRLRGIDLPEFRYFNRWEHQGVRARVPPL